MAEIKPHNFLWIYGRFKYGGISHENPVIKETWSGTSCQLQLDIARLELLDAGVLYNH